MNATVTHFNPNYIEDREQSTKKICNPKQLKVKEIQNQENVDSETIRAIESEHMTIYHNILSYYAFLGKFFGVTCRFEWNVYGNFFFWFTNFLLVLANFCVGYTGYVYYQQGDIRRTLEPFAICGIAFTCSLKWYFYLKYLHNVLALMFAVKRICEEINTGNRVDTILAGLKRTYSVLRAYATALIGGILFFVAVPLKFFIVDHINYPVMPVLVPFFEDISILKNYLFAIVIQSLFGIYSAVSTLTFGSGFLFVICNYRLLVNLIELDFNDLNDMWSPLSDTPVAVRHAFLNNIAAKLQDMQRYMREVKMIYEAKFFVFFLISYVGQVICLYQITVTDWLTGYTILLTVFVEMMFYCMIGTQITTLGDIFCDFIQRTEWYTFDLHSQRTLLFMLQRCQQPCGISLFSLGQLDMVTGINILKGIYCYYTFITEMM